MVTAYPVRGKQKSVDLCTAFIEGAGGGRLVTQRLTLDDGPAFFWGVDESNREIWKAARARGDYFYGDNSYFDGTARGDYFRITRNRLQHSGEGASNGKRFAALGINITTVHGRGDHLVVCPQSEAFMRDVVGYRGDWLAQTLEELDELTEIEIRVRHWNRDKAAAQATLGDDLAGAYALITWSSAAAITAALAGVPPFVGGDCPARLIGNSDLSYLANPSLAPFDLRQRWAGVLADNQWTMDEIRAGAAWEALQK